MVGRKDLDTTEQLTLSFHLMTLQIKKQCVKTKPIILVKGKSGPS